MKWANRRKKNKLFLRIHCLASKLLYMPRFTIHIWACYKNRHLLGPVGVLYRGAMWSYQCSFAHKGNSHTGSHLCCSVVWEREPTFLLCYFWFCFSGFPASRTCMNNVHCNIVRLSHDSGLIHKMEESGCHFRKNVMQSLMHCYFSWPSPKPWPCGGSQSYSSSISLRYSHYAVPLGIGHLVFKGYHLCCSGRDAI